MTRRYALLAAAAVCAGLAVVLAVLARDVGRRADAIRAGDVAAAAGKGSWSVDETLPFKPAARLLGIGDDLAFRNAAALFRRARSTTLNPNQPPGAAAQRIAAEAALAHVIRSDRAAERASAASNMLGILAFLDAIASTRGGDTSADRSILELQRAIHLDSRNQLAKANLELVYQQHSAPYSVRGLQRLQRSAHAGASASTPGSGY
jgi:hypothetical protein